MALLAALASGIRISAAKAGEVELAVSISAAKAAGNPKLFRQLKPLEKRKLISEAKAGEVELSVSISAAKAAGNPKLFRQLKPA
jgi:hypothetical protein